MAPLSQSLRNGAEAALSLLAAPTGHGPSAFPFARWARTSVAPHENCAAQCEIQPQSGRRAAVRMPGARAGLCAAGGRRHRDRSGRARALSRPRAQPSRTGDRAAGGFAALGPALCGARGIGRAGADTLAPPCPRSAGRGRCGRRGRGQSAVRQRSQFPDEAGRRAGRSRAGKIAGGGPCGRGQSPLVARRAPIVCARLARRAADRGLGARSAIATGVARSAGTPRAARRRGWRAIRACWHGIISIRSPFRRVAARRRTGAVGRWSPSVCASHRRWPCVTMPADRRPRSISAPGITPRRARWLRRACASCCSPMAAPKTARFWRATVPNGAPDAGDQAPDAADSGNGAGHDRARLRHPGRSGQFHHRVRRDHRASHACLHSGAFVRDPGDRAQMGCKARQFLRAVGARGVHRRLRRSRSSHADRADPPRAGDRRRSRRNWINWSR